MKTYTALLMATTLPLTYSNYKSTLQSAGVKMVEFGSEHDIPLTKLFADIIIETYYLNPGRKLRADKPRPRLYYTVILLDVDSDELMKNIAVEYIIKHTEGSSHLLKYSVRDYIY